MPFSSSWRRDVTDEENGASEKQNSPFDYLRDNSLNENENLEFNSPNEPAKPRFYFSYKIIILLHTKLYVRIHQNLFSSSLCNE